MYQKYPSRNICPNRFLRINSREVEAPEKLLKQSVLDVYKKSTRFLTSTNTLLSSISATFLPKHWYFPNENTRSNVCSSSFIFSAESLSHLSGRNTSASSPNISLSLKIPNASYPMDVPPGMNIPLITSPAGGTSFAISPTTGGQYLRPSLMIACR